MPKTSDKPDSVIEKARELHGHLGPFLVIGVRMGEICEENVERRDESAY